MIKDYYYIKSFSPNKKPEEAKYYYGFFSLKYAKKAVWVIAQHPNGKLVYITHRIVGSFKYVENELKEFDDLKYVGTITGKDLFNSKDYGKTESSYATQQQKPEEFLEEKMKNEKFCTIYPNTTKTIKLALSGVVV
jgi:hypothetical protein